MSASKDSGKTSRRPPLTLVQMLTIVGVVVGLLILLDFNRRLAAEQQLVNASNQARTAVAALEAEHSLLLTQVAYATTEPAVIEWAHRAKMAQAGEILVVPIMNTAEPTPLPPPVSLPPPPPTWQLWENLFLGAAPPTVP
jgi:hypothetical protein